MNFSELSESFEQAVCWFHDTGLSVNRTRVAEYSKELKRLANWHAEGTLARNITTSSAHHWRSILYEAHEIVEIFSAFSSHHSLDFIRRLTEVAKGPLFLADEVPGSAASAARNYQFELLAAARFQKYGFQVFLNDRYDFAIRLDGLTIPFECKRPHAMAQVNKRIKDGCAQLKSARERLPPASRAPGILIFSIEKLNEQFKLLLLSQSAAIAKAALNEKCSQFFHKYQRRVREKGGRHVGGFVVSLNTMSEVAGQINYGTFSVASYWADHPSGHTIRSRLSDLGSS